MEVSSLVSLIEKHVKTSSNIFSQVHLRGLIIQNVLSNLEKLPQRKIGRTLPIFKFTEDKIHSTTGSWTSSH